MIAKTRNYFLLILICWFACSVSDYFRVGIHELAHLYTAKLAGASVGNVFIPPSFTFMKAFTFYDYCKSDSWRYLIAVSGNLANIISGLLVFYLALPFIKSFYPRLLSLTFSYNSIISASIATFYGVISNNWDGRIIRELSPFPIFVYPVLFIVLLIVLYKPMAKTLHNFLNDYIQQDNFLKRLIALPIILSFPITLDFPHVVLVMILFSFIPPTNLIPNNEKKRVLLKHLGTSFALYILFKITFLLMFGETRDTFFTKQISHANRKISSTTDNAQYYYNRAFWTTKAWYSTNAENAELLLALKDLDTASSIDNKLTYHIQLQKANILQSMGESVNPQQNNQVLSKQKEIPIPNNELIFKRKEAISYFNRAASSRIEAIRINPNLTKSRYFNYDMACLFALAENKKEALSWLIKSVDDGLADYKHVTKDEDLRILWREKKYLEILGKIRNNEKRLVWGPLAKYL